MMRSALFVILLVSVSFSACSGNITHPVVAVVGDGGGLVNLTIRASPGTGEDYIGLLPYAGVSTQQSAKYAINYARNAASEDTSDCDITVVFGDLPTGEYVEGPSAGASMAVMSYALFEGLPVREDAVITGSLEPGGLIGPVGGLYEKAKTSGQTGIKYFITPFTNVYEFITLESVEEQYGIRIIQANTISEVINFMIYNETIEEREASVFESRIPEDMAPYYDEGLEPFRNVALGMMEFERYVLDDMPGSDETLWINEYFNSTIEEQKEYIELGYYFTAANDAFLNYIEISTINTVFTGDINLGVKRDSVEYCLDSLERPVMTDENFEWVAGSDLRRAWSENKLNDTDTDTLLIEEKHAAYNSLMYADAWCRVSGMLAENAVAGGNEIDESGWERLAEQKISEAEDYPHSAETLDRLEIAKQSYGDGKYAAAIFDAAYVISMDYSDLALLEMTDENLSSTVSYYSNRERNSLWGKVYQSQALFLIRQNEPNYAAAYRLFIYADELDNSIAQMELEMEYGEKETRENDIFLFAFSILIFLLFSFVLLFILPKLKRRSYGSSGKKRRGADRAQQKKTGTGTQKKLSRAEQKRR